MDILLFAALIFGGMMLFRAMRGGASARPAAAGPLGGAAPYASPPGDDSAYPGSGGTDATGVDEAPGWFDA